MVAVCFGVVLEVVGDDVELPLPRVGDSEQCEPRWAGQYLGGSCSGSCAWTKIKVTTNISTLIAYYYQDKQVPYIRLSEVPGKSSPICDDQDKPATFLLWLYSY